MIRKFALAAAFVAGASVPLAAHHGWSSYDASKPQTLEGKIATSNYGNPHASITMEASGKVWTVILAPVSRMESRGASAEMVAVGKTISAYGYPKKDGEAEMRAERITAEGKTVELR